MFKDAIDKQKESKVFLMLGNLPEIPEATMEIKASHDEETLYLMYVIKRPLAYTGSCINEVFRFKNQNDSFNQRAISRLYRLLTKVVGKAGADELMDVPADRLDLLIKKSASVIDGSEIIADVIVQEFNNRKFNRVKF